MDRQLLERLIGAGVLVVALVIIVPAILDGDQSDVADDAESKSAVSTTTNETRRTHTIRLDQSKESPPVAREIKEPSVVDTGAKETGNNQDSVKSPTPAPEPKVAAPPVVRKEAPARAEPKPKPVTAPERKPEPPPIEPESVPKSGWVVQLGSFSSRPNAQQLADEVRGRGFPVFLMAVDRSGKKLYRVRVGPRETRAQAAELAGRLDKAGYSGQVTAQ